ncbi:MAG: sigma-54 dependent transcriptional regulator [Bdellovibrionota bacterium]
MLRILVVEDEAHNREALLEMLKRLGHEPYAAVDGHEGLELFSKMSFDLILSDVRMPRMDGLQLLEALRQLVPPEMPMPAFAFMTAYGRIEDAVSAMRKGALNFLSKPLRKKDIVALLEEVEYRISIGSAHQAETDAHLGDAVYASRAFGEVVGLVDRVAASLASVLFVGESGTGKEVLARRLHEKSARNQGPFVAFHAGAMPETLLESELFGHEKGAFTGAEQARIGRIRSAHGGTFFFDELATMPLGVQAKILRVVQDRSVLPLGATTPVDCDVRWIAATNKELGPLVTQGSFREDLLYRLSVIVIDLPPLRDRPEDIEILTDHFMREFSEREGRKPLAISQQTRQLLRAYSWPGNVRELRNVIERAFALSVGQEFGLELLPSHIAESQRSREIRFAVGTPLQSVEDRMIEETLASCNGDKNQAATILGVAPRTIYRWLERREQEQRGQEQEEV